MSTLTTPMMSSMIKEYFDIYTEKVKEYGERTCVLYENGAFYEIYQIEDNDGNQGVGNAFTLSKILNDMKYTSKIIGKIQVHFIGFNTICLDKFLPLLLSANYTVVIVSQLESADQRKTKGNLKRGVTKIYSPSLQPLDYNSGNLVSILINIDTVKSSNKINANLVHNINTSVCCVKNEYNDIQITENTFKCNINDTHVLNLCLDELERLIYRYFAKEIHVKIVSGDGDGDGEPGSWCLKRIEEFFKNNYENVLLKYIANDEFKHYSKTDIQTFFLNETYPHINFGMISPIEYINLQNLSIVNLMFTIEFIGRHDSSYILNLNLPQLIVENKHLILELNTITQLNITGKGNSVFDIVNHTKTAIGKRHLLNILCNPFKQEQIINLRYNVTENVGCISKELSIYFSVISDFEKLHRKMSLQLLHPFEFEKLDQNYNTILKIINLYKAKCSLTEILPDEKHLNQLEIFMKDYLLKFNLNIMKKIDLNTGKDEIVNYFNKGIIPELDLIQETIDKIELEREQLRLFYDSKINPDSKGEMIKLVYTENEGYAFVCTKIRFKLLSEKCKEINDLRAKHSNNTTKFFPDLLIKLSNQLIKNREQLHKKIKMYYLEQLKDYYISFNSLFHSLKHFIEIIDVCHSNYKCAERYNYTKPILVNYDTSSFFQAEQLRHPIIERLNTKYIPNDISLTNEKNGMLLYGLNSAGKSSLLRAIGINVILAQCGLYVPCKSFVFRPFDTVISQVDLTDNLFSGKSSYINEMIGLRKILKCSGKNTLVLSDELSKGTEINSSVSLVSAVILKLIKNNTKLFFTTHLHDVAKIIKDNDKIQIRHLDVSIRNGKDIVFERKLKDGSGSELYGLEVAKSLLEDLELIDSAFAIRNELIGKTTSILSTKKSVYNKKKIIKSCEICKSTKNLETDHIKPQCDTDEAGFVHGESFHKNETFNLAILCKNCHLQKTQGKIIINGYKDSLNGKFLDYTFV